MSRFRIAPTPSGYLHRGNALNFVLTWWQARLIDGEVGLRIDDHDEARCRLEYLDDIFKTLEWLGLDWDFGPQDRDDFQRNYSQCLKKEYYFKELQQAQLPLFGCYCSRKEIRDNGGDHPKSCAERGLPFVRGKSAWRIEGEEEYILWRKDDIPAYQWVSILEDRDQKITHLVRGEDLRSSTAFQLSLAKEMKISFPEHLYHHELLKEGSKKLSKSQKSASVRRSFKGPQDFYREVVSPFLNEEVTSAQELRSLGHSFF